MCRTASALSATGVPLMLCPHPAVARTETAAAQASTRRRVRERGTGLVGIVSATFTPPTVPHRADPGAAATPRGNVEAAAAVVHRTSRPPAVCDASARVGDNGERLPRRERWWTAQEGVRDG
ncbi:hypothetical protein GCM10011610_09030 [Nocardia rhizosphaerihabitans]|uniref:Secreted protein n=1 Tax=Nocardia rhizosphaerihabitans TaxID=1691570 RepID=A0ABQ2K5G1_9NOCA|nr:hypothetical protein GCM10011610_09030 [Nocardia rhizosphaerihabitans]